MEFIRINIMEAGRKIKNANWLTITLHAMQLYRHLSGIPDRQSDSNKYL